MKETLYQMIEKSLDTMVNEPFVYEKEYNMNSNFDINQLDIDSSDAASAKEDFDLCYNIQTMHWSEDKDSPQLVSIRWKLWIDDDA